MGIVVSIMRDATMPDCSNNGVSARFNRLTITNVDGPFEPTADAPAAVIVKRRYVGNVVIVPGEAVGRANMFGGCVAYCSDDRFAAKLRELSGYEYNFPVNIHDRVE